ncbi:MAG TPA: phage tail protein [Roseiflexaceae bacterium]|nr:phage tail protein [Roseiflexaceae bacterium]HMP41643.1 phage tail protein [Roseiflexaceae bacterium]
MTVASSNFYTTFRFVIELQGITEAMFDECNGLTSEIETIPVVEGGQNEYVLQLPVRVKQSANLVLKRGIASIDLWNWYYDVVRGTVNRKNLSVILIGHDTLQQIRWDFIGVLPIKWAGPELRSGENNVAFETIDFAHKGFKRVAS